MHAYNETHNSSLAYQLCSRDGVIVAICILIFSFCLCSFYALFYCLLFFLRKIPFTYYILESYTLQVHSTSDGNSAAYAQSDFPGGEAAHNAINYSSRHRSPSTPIIS